MFGTEFRPLTFDSVYGLSIIKKILIGDLRSNSFDSGYLFVGPYSSGKTTLSRLFARSILCESRQSDMSPCNTCQSCKDFLANKHSGYLEIDAANNGTKDRIQEIKELLKYESITGKRIILFDEAQNITKEGKDALLLQLEMDDPNVVIIFCTTEVDKMPSALKSRCCDFRIPEPSEKDIIQKLVNICEIKAIKYDRDALHIIVRAVGRHYRDAENKLRQISLLGDVNMENVKSVVSLYDNEIAIMLLALPNDLSASLKTAENLISLMDIRQIYASILRLINDSIKSMSGITYESADYSSIVTSLRNGFGNVLFEMLDFVLGKNRLNDVTIFQSDILILHYKFLKGGFKFKAFDVPEQVSQVKKRVDTQDEGREILDNKNLQPWERDDKLRNLKAKKLHTEKNERVTETVSKVWGPDIKSKIPEQPQRTNLTKEQFGQIIGGASEPDRI
jgi:DNA polymerase III subunit gamma/tau